MIIAQITQAALVAKRPEVTPDREQFPGRGVHPDAGPVPDPAHDQSGGDLLLLGVVLGVFGGAAFAGAQRVGDLGDLGVGDRSPVSGSVTAPG